MNNYAGPLDKEQRAYIRDSMSRWSAERYRITAAGEVHFYGRMPNSNESGWWLFAQSRAEANRRIGEEWLARTAR